MDNTKLTMSQSPATHQNTMSKDTNTIQPTSLDKLQRAFTLATHAAEALHDRNTDEILDNIAKYINHCAAMTPREYDQLRRTAHFITETEEVDKMKHGR